MQRLATLTVLAALAAPGCLGTPSYPLQEPAGVGGAQRLGGTARLYVSVSRYRNKVPVAANLARTSWSQLVLSAHQDSGIFDSYSTDHPDYIVEVEIRAFETSNRIRDVLAGMTLLLIPTWSSFEMVADTKVMNASSREEVGSSQARFSYRKLGHLIFLPFALANQPFRLDDSVVYGVAQESLVSSLAGVSGEVL